MERGRGATAQMQRGRGAEKSFGWGPTRVGPLRTLHRPLSLPLLPLFSVCLFACMAPAADSLKEREVREARRAFEANLEAIRARDLEAYLAGYLDSPDFVYLGPDGVARGFAPFAAARRAEAAFPDSLAAGTPELTWLAPGVVHVAYPFAARQGTVTGVGWSERVLVRTTVGWRIAVTSVIPGVGDGGARAMKGDEGR